MYDSTRRRFLRMSGVSVAGGLAGCSGVLGGDDEEDDIKDTDGDGVIDSEDYAPRDPSVQRAEQVQESDPTATPTERQTNEPSDTPTKTATRTETPNSRTFVERFEDTNLDEYTGNLNQFDIQSSVVLGGDYSLECSSSRPMTIERTISVRRPSVIDAKIRGEDGGRPKVGFHDLENGQIMVAKLDYKHNELVINPRSVGDRVAVDNPVENTTYHVRFDLDWSNKIIGKVVVNGEERLTDIPFRDETDQIIELKLSMNSPSSGTGWWDDILLRA